LPIPPHKPNRNEKRRASLELRILPVIVLPIWSFRATIRTWRAQAPWP